MDKEGCGLSSLYVCEAPTLCSLCTAVLLQLLLYWDVSTRPSILHWWGDTPIHVTARYRRVNRLKAMLSMLTKPEVGKHAPPLRTNCAPIAHQLRTNCAPIAHQLCTNCPPIARTNCAQLRNPKRKKYINEFGPRILKQEEVVCVKRYRPSLFLIIRSPKNPNFFR